MNGYRRLFGFRSGKRWHRACTVAAVGLLAILFALTPLPFVPAANQDVLLYKAIRLLLFAAPLGCWILLSDFPGCKRVPLFSSEQPGRRALGAAALAAFLVCAGVNLYHLHTDEYRASVQAAVASLAFPNETAEEPPDQAPQSKAEAEAPAAENTSDEPSGTGGTWEGALAERREGCGTD